MNGRTPRTTDLDPLVTLPPTRRYAYPTLRLCPRGWVLCVRRGATAFMEESYGSDTLLALRVPAEGCERARVALAGALGRQGAGHRETGIGGNAPRRRR